MASITSMPIEILHLIFGALQNVTAGPRYVLRKPLEQGNPNTSSVSNTDSKTQARWTLSDAGPLHLAASCKNFREIYFSPYIPFNLILEIANPPGTKIEADKYYDFWHTGCGRGNLENHLRRLQKSFRGKPLTRFEFQWRWDFDHLNVYLQHMEMWTETLRDVSEVFGDELIVVICNRGMDVEKDLINHAPRRIRALEERDRSFRGRDSLLLEVARDSSQLEPDTQGGKVTTRSRSNQLFEGTLPLPDRKPAPRRAVISTSMPLALHVYFGHGQPTADILMSCILEMFANKNLQSFYFSSDPNNFQVHGHGRRPAEGRELYQTKNPYAVGNPWRFLLPSISQAYETLQSITLDCTLFWSEIAYCLPHLYKLKLLDCELVLMYTEPFYPFELERRERAREGVTNTLALKDADIVRQMKLKKNKDKKWLDIEIEGLQLPKIEPCKNALGTEPRSRFANVQMEVCLQVRKGRIFKGRRG
jgi:hypothetical protein